MIGVPGSLPGDTVAPSTAPQPESGSRRGSPAPEAEPAAHVRAAIRTPARAQEDFRALLSALARPGALEAVALGDSPPAVAVAAGLADVEVPTAVLTSPDEEHWARALHLATSAPVAPPHRAAMVVALRPPTTAEVAGLRRGDAMHPEHGTRLIIAVDALTPALRGRGLGLVLSGPGVQGTRAIEVRGLPAAVFAALGRANAGFPAGVDTFLVASDGTIAGLPRSARVEIVNGED
jgi:alpha-D-ribose 1-methylphosphonate 5-triphosphate synthase subunit PhnH